MEFDTIEISQVVIVIVVVNPRHPPLKFGQNKFSNILVIADNMIYKDLLFISF